MQPLPVDFCVMPLQPSCQKGSDPGPGPCPFRYARTVAPGEKLAPELVSQQVPSFLLSLFYVFWIPFFEKTRMMSALASSSARVNRPHLLSSSSAAFSSGAPPALLRIKIVLA